MSDTFHSTYSWLLHFLCRGEPIECHNIYITFTFVFPTTTEGKNEKAVPNRVRNYFSAAPDAALSKTEFRIVEYSM